MYIKTHILVILLVAVIAAMVAEKRYVAFTTRDDTARHYHGLCNYGVGEPYTNFVHELRMLYESGQTNELGRALIAADERSAVIYDVWLFDQREAYRSSTQEIFR